MSHQSTHADQSITSEIPATPGTQKTHKARENRLSRSRQGIPTAKDWASIARHLIVPVFMVLGMALAYLGAFHAPHPHQVPVAIVGDSPQTQVFAQQLANKFPEELHVITVDIPADAQQRVADRSLAGAFDENDGGATLLVASAASETRASVVEKIFQGVAQAQNVPLKMVDVRANNAQDPTGQGLFFLLVAMTVGSYAGAIAVAAATARLGIAWRVLAAAATALLMSAIAVGVTAGVYHVVNANVWGLWLISALYAFGVITVGVGLHPMLRAWTTAALILLFVMLNFTSSGGIFPPDLEPGFFRGLNTFWNGAGWMDAARTLSYFPGQGIGWDVFRLGVWAVVGLGLIGLAHLATLKRQQLANDRLAVSEEEQESVVAAG